MKTSEYSERCLYESLTSCRVNCGRVRRSLPLSVSIHKGYDAVCQQSTNKVKMNTSKSKTGHANTDESCVSSEDDLDNEGRSATSLSPPSTLTGGKRPRTASSAGRRGTERAMEMEPMTVSPARSDCLSDDPSVTRFQECPDGGCSKRSGQYIQLSGDSRLATGSSSLRMRREQSGGGSGYGSGSESSTSAATIPDVVRTRQSEYSGTDYGTINRAISGAKVVQIMEKGGSTNQGPPPPPPPPPQSKHGGSERSVTFSPSAKRPADMTTTYDTFGKPRRAVVDTGEPRYSAGPVSRRTVSGGSADLLTNGRLSPPLPPPPPEARHVDEAYGTLGSSSCSTLASGGTASSGSSGSVVTVIAAGPGYDVTAGGSLMRRQLARQPPSGGSGTLPATKKDGRGSATTGLAPK